MDRIRGLGWEVCTRHRIFFFSTDGSGAREEASAAAQELGKHLSSPDPAPVYLMGLKYFLFPLPSSPDPDPISFCGDRIMRVAGSS